MSTARLVFNRRRRMSRTSQDTRMSKPADCFDRNNWGEKSHQKRLLAESLNGVDGGT